MSVATVLTRKITPPSFVSVLVERLDLATVVYASPGSTEEGTELILPGSSNANANANANKNNVEIEIELELELEPSTGATESNGNNDDAPASTSTSSSATKKAVVTSHSDSDGIEAGIIEHEREHERKQPANNNDNSSNNNSPKQLVEEAETEEHNVFSEGNNNNNNNDDEELLSSDKHQNERENDEPESLQQQEPGAEGGDGDNNNRGGSSYVSSAADQLARWNESIEELNILPACTSILLQHPPPNPHTSHPTARESQSQSQSDHGVPARAMDDAEGSEFWQWTAFIDNDWYKTTLATAFGDAHASDIPGKRPNKNTNTNTSVSSRDSDGVVDCFFTITSSDGTVHLFEAGGPHDSRTIAEGLRWATTRWTRLLIEGNATTLLSEFYAGGYGYGYESESKTESETESSPGAFVCVLSPTESMNRLSHAFLDDLTGVSTFQL
eukprot:jgi/Psemu1/325069/estExt_fgenesh1_pg.C_2000017